MMRRFIYSTLIWLFSTALLCAVIYLRADTAFDAISRPRPNLAMVVDRVMYFVLPSVLVAGAVFASCSKTRPGNRAVLASVGVAVPFVALGQVLAAIALVVERIARTEMLAMSATVTAIIILIVGYARAPLVLPQSGGGPAWRLNWGPWLRMIPTMLVLVLCIVVLTYLAGRSLADALADFAVSLGGHYYTFLNFAGPVILVAISMMMAVQLGLAWARAHDRTA